MMAPCAEWRTHASTICRRCGAVNPQFAEVRSTHAAAASAVASRVHLI